MPPCQLSAGPRQHIGVNAAQFPEPPAHPFVRVDDRTPIACLAPKFQCIRRFMSTTQARAMWAGSQPVVVGCLKTVAGNDGITKSKASDALAPCAVGLVSGSDNLQLLRQPTRAIRA